MKLANLDKRQKIFIGSFAFILLFVVYLFTIAILTISLSHVQGKGIGYFYNAIAFIYRYFNLKLPFQASSKDLLLRSLNRSLLPLSLCIPLSF